MHICLFNLCVGSSGGIDNVLTNWAGNLYIVIFLYCLYKTMDNQMVVTMLKSLDQGSSDFNEGGSGIISSAI
jgi:hypothetical protein